MAHLSLALLPHQLPSGVEAPPQLCNCKTPAAWENYNENAGGKCFNNISANLFLTRHVLQHYVARYGWEGRFENTFFELIAFSALSTGSLFVLFMSGRENITYGCTLQHSQSRM